MMGWIRTAEGLFTDDGLGMLGASRRRLPQFPLRRVLRGGLTSEALSIMKAEVVRHDIYCALRALSANKGNPDHKHD
jgi:hypothetical protein